MGWTTVAEADAALGISEVLAACVSNHRRRQGRHTLHDLLRQWLVAAGSARLTPETLRLRLIKSSTRASPVGRNACEQLSPADRLHLRLLALPGAVVD